MFWKRSTPKADVTQRTLRTSALPVAKPPAEPKPADKIKLAPEQVKTPDAASDKTSFDPYNSGAFDRRDTWGKVIRK